MEECVKSKILAVVGMALFAAACGTNGGSSSNRSAAAAVQITGAGSTFVYPVLSAWSADYRKQTGAAINYQSIGSGGGISQIKAGTVDFGASDQPLDPKELAEAGLAQFPIVVGGVVPVVNVSGIDPGKLRLTGPVLADIYAGKIKSWNDPVIARLNPGLSLPSADIVVVHRSDGSGTTFNFTHYLSQISPAWKSGAGEGKTVAWLTGVGGKGNEGVAGQVRQLQGSIGYIELIYAVQNKIPYGVVKNSGGNYVKASLDSVTAAAASAKTIPADFRVSITNAPGKEAYPISSFTWLLVPEKSKDAGKGKILADFLNWMVDDGQKMTAELTYAPLPESVASKVKGAIKQVQ